MPEYKEITPLKTYEKLLKIQKIILHLTIVIDIIIIAQNK